MISELDSSTELWKCTHFPLPLPLLLHVHRYFTKRWAMPGKYFGGFSYPFCMHDGKTCKNKRDVSLRQFRTPFASRYSVGNYISCFAKRFCKVLDYANLIRWTRVWEERGRAEKNPCTLLICPRVSLRGGGCRKLLVGILRRFAAIKTQEGGTSGGRIRRGAREGAREAKGVVDLPEWQMVRNNTTQPNARHPTSGAGSCQPRLGGTISGSLPRGRFPWQYR